MFENVVFPVELPLPSTLVIGEKSFIEVVACECVVDRIHSGSKLTLFTVPESIKCFQNFAKSFGNLSIHTIKDMIEYNERNHVFPSQATWQKGLNSHIEPAALVSAIRESRRLGRTDGLDKVFERYGIDMVIAPGDSPLCVLAAAAGYPIATAPMDVLKYNGRPFGISLIARASKEDLLLEFLGVWEKIVGSRPLPLPLMEGEDST